MSKHDELADVELPPFKILVDTREQRPWIFPKETPTETATLKTGDCTFAGGEGLFGIQHESENNRYRRMMKTHPKLYNYCINTLGFGAVLDFIGVPYRDEMDQLEFDWGKTA